MQGHNVDAGWRGRVGDTAQLLVDREHKFDELQNNDLRKDMASDLTKNGALAYRDWKTVRATVRASFALSSLGAFSVRVI